MTDPAGIAQVGAYLLTTAQRHLLGATHLQALPDRAPGTCLHCDQNWTVTPATPGAVQLFIDPDTNASILAVTHPRCRPPQVIHEPGLATRLTEEMREDGGTNVSTWPITRPHPTPRALLVMSQVVTVVGAYGADVRDELIGHYLSNGMHLVTGDPLDAAPPPTDGWTASVRRGDFAVRDPGGSELYYQPYGPDLAEWWGTARSEGRLTVLFTTHPAVAAAMHGPPDPARRYAALRAATDAGKLAAITVRTA